MLFYVICGYNLCWYDFVTYLLLILDNVGFQARLSLKTQFRAGLNLTSSKPSQLIRLLLLLTLILSLLHFLLIVFHLLLLYFLPLNLLVLLILFFRVFDGPLIF